MSVVLPARAVEELSERGALNIAKRDVQNQCGSRTPCSFSAMRRKDEWLVQVGFTKRDVLTGRPYSYAGGNATILIDAHGRILKRINGAAR